MASSSSDPTSNQHPLKRYSSQTIFHQVEDLPDSIIDKLDVVIVLGGGAPADVEEPPLYVKERCDVAAQIVEKRRRLDKETKMRHRHGKSDLKPTDLPILCLSAGTAHLPQLLSKSGLPIWESTSSAAYLQSQHNLSNLYVETTSYDTIGNAFYTRTSHTDVNGWRRLLVVTSEFHMQRTKAIFDWIFLSLEDSPKQKYVVEYLAAKNVGLTDEAVEARKEKEASSTQSIHDFGERYRTLKDVWQFLTHEHALYTASKLVERAKVVPSDAGTLVKKSYGG